MTSVTVTATQGGTGAQDGIALSVKVLTGAAAVQNGATGSSSTLTTPQQALTPAATGSLIYGAVTNENSATAFTPDASTQNPFSQNVPFPGDGDTFGCFRSLNTTTANSAVTVGASAPAGVPTTELFWAAAEILAAAALTEDPSSPAAVSTTAATAVSTAAFTPPANSLIVATVSSNYTGSGTLTMTVSGGGLRWTQLAGETLNLASVWIAWVPGHVSLSFSSGRTSWNLGGPVQNPVQGPVFTQAARPARPRLIPPPRGRIASSPGGPAQNPPPPATAGPPFFPARQAIRAKLPQPPLGTGAFRGRASSSPGAPVQNPAPGPVFRQKPAPVRFTLPPWQPRAGRIGSSFGAPVINPAHGPPVYAPQGPVRARLPQFRPRAGRTGSSPGAPPRNPVSGPVFTQAAQPARARLPLRPLLRGRTASSPGGPLRNPAPGPVFTQADRPARARIPQAFSKGRAGGSPGGQAGRTYYVSPSGSDSNNGLSPSAAWQTAAKVNGTTLHPGDTVLFQGGQTFSGTMLQPGQAGTASLPVTFGSYGTGQATITTSASTAIYVYESGGIAVENLIITGPGAATAGAGGYVGVYFNRDVAGYAAPVSVTGCTITGWADGILVTAADAGGGYSGITITGCSVSANRDAGINIAGSGYSHQNVTVTGNTVYSQAGDSGNTATSSGHGIVTGNASGGVISQNVTYGNGASCGCTTAGPVGNWAYSSQNLVIEYNVSYGNLTATPGNADGDGFDLDDDCVGCVLQYNIAYENAGSGIACYSDDSGWSGNVIRYNLTWGNAVTNPDAAEIAFLGGPFANASVYGNTFVGQTNAELPSVVLLYGASFTSVNLWNNIFYTAASGVSLAYADTAYTGVTFQGNLYYSAAPFLISWGGTSYSSLAAWRTGTSQEILSGHNTGFQANPQFNAPGTTPAVTSPSNLAPADGLQLAPGSPAAAQGLNLAALFSVNPGTQDFFGNTLAYPLWAGAYQGLLVPPPGAPVRARIPQPHPRAGRIAAGAGVPAQNPAKGPVFRQAARPAAARLPVPFLKGRVSSNAGAPARNPAAGPVFRAAVRPARAVIPQVFSRGRAASGPGIPVPAPPVPVSGPVFRPRVTPARAWVRPGQRGRIASGPGARAVNPAPGPVFTQAVRPVAAKIPLRPRAGGSASNTSQYVAPPVPPVPPVLWQFYGHVPVYYLDYLDGTTRETLYAVPGGIYVILIANTRAGLTIPPGDGRWTLGDPADIPLHRRVFLRLRAHIHKSRRRSGYRNPPAG